jgi:flagellin-like hook-associated protein FlgL
MSLVVGTNSSAQLAQDALRTTQRKHTTTMERLATGLRINSAKDDAAGLAISQKMTSQIKGLNQAVRNINDGISLLQTADGALSAVTDMLQRIRELAVQSANGTYSDADREYLQMEALALEEQIRSVIGTTNWNGKKLLDGSFSNQIIQAGPNMDGIIEITIPSISISGANPLISSGPMWTKMLSSSGSVHINAMAKGNDGYIYTTGILNGTIDGQIAGQEDFILNKYDKEGNRIWSKILGTVSGVDVSNAITIGQDGSIYIAGSTNGNLTNPSNTDSIGDILIAKYATDGSLIWAKQMGAPQDDRVFSLSTGSDGSIFLTGTTTGNLGGTSSIGGDSVFSGQGDAFVAKIDSNGDQIWLNQLSGTQFGNGVTAGPDGSAYAVGTMDGALNGVTPVGGTDAFVTKFKADGTVAWTTNIGTSTTDLGEKITVTNNGDIYVTGSTYGSLDGNNVLGNRESFLTKLNPDGRIQWSRQLNLGSYNATTSIVTNADGNIFIGGWWPQDGTQQGGSAFVAQYSPDGSKISSQLVAQSYSFTNSLVVDEKNSLYVTGSSTYGVNGEIFSGPVDGFLIKYSGSGLDVATQSGANAAIDSIDQILNIVNSNRSTIGSYVNRLIHAADNATNMSINLKESRSAILDADYAIETTNLAKSQIIQQAATAMLAQANQQPQLVLKLLEGL